jgi:predicted DNA binding protein
MNEPMADKKTTLAEIAQQLGISKITVSGR